MLILNAHVTNFVYICLYDHYNAVQCNQGIQSLSTGHVHVQISGLYYEGNIIYASFSIIEGKMQGNQIEIWSIQTTLLEIS